LKVSASALRSKNISKKGSAELQIALLRFATVEMTKGRAKLPWRAVAGQRV
jgi:hypothetical protein